MGPSPRRLDIANEKGFFCHAHPGKPDRNAEVMTVQRIWGQEWRFHGAGTKIVIWTGDKCYKPFKKSLNEHKSLKTALENQASSIRWVLCPRGGNVWGYSGITHSPGHLQGNIPLIPLSMQLKEGVSGFTHQYPWWICGSWKSPVLFWICSSLLLSQPAHCGSELQHLLQH